MDKLKAKILGYKKVRINGLTYVIRKINPILDFDLRDMPNIFTSAKTKRDSLAGYSEKKILENMYKVLEAGIVSPPLVPVEKTKEGLTAEDIFRGDYEMGVKLFNEIILLSLNRFRGLRGLFFSAKIRFYFYIIWLKVMVNYRRTLLSAKRIASH